jgi:hypothetical protein
MLSPFGGMQIIESDAMVESFEDWSRVRSPGRARRRMKYGHRQNVQTLQKPRCDALIVDNRMFVHPVVAHELRRMSRAV